MTTRPFLRIAGAFLAASLVISGAAAQQPPQGGASGGASIPGPQATPSHLAAARELVVASGLSRSFAAVVPDLMGQINMNFTRTRPEIAKDLKATLDQLQPEFNGYGDEINDIAARVYTVILNEQETKDAVAFFKSPSGKKYVEVQPTIFANLAPALDSWSKALSVRMLDRVRTEMKKKGIDL